MKRTQILTYIFYGACGAFLLIAGFRFGEYRTINTYRDRGIGRVITTKDATSAASTKPSIDQRKTLDNNDHDIDFGIFWEAWDIFEKRFVDRAKLDTTKMFYNAVKGLVSTGEDPYTFFLTPEENTQSKDSLGGKFEGIGAQLGTKDGRIVVIAPIKNSPAIRAGVKAGDIILEVNGVETKGKTLTEVVTKIRGEAGTVVKLTLGRDDKEIPVSITRAQIQVDSIEVTYDKGIAHLKLSQFGTQVRDEWDKTIPELARKYKAGEIHGLILDLRGNPGGLLDACVYMAGDFLPMGKLVVKQVGIEDTIEYTVTHLPRLQSIPMVVLIDKGSASASEILAGALRDHGRAKLVGEKSFGKGSVQGTFDLSNGSGMHVTVAKWLLPKGEWINGKGIEPEIKIENPELDQANTLDAKANDKQLEKAFQLLLR